MSAQCRGRLTGKSKKPDGKGTLEFIKDDPEKKRGNIFFVPVRCSGAVAVSGEALCAVCDAKRRTTEAKECVKNGTYVANQETLFHGLVGETPPVWSHVYKSIWFNEFVKSPKHRITKETFAIAEAGLAACPGGPEAELGKAVCVVDCVDECVAGTGSEPVTIAKAKAKAKAPAEMPAEMSAEMPAEPPVAKEPAPKPFMPPKKKVTIVETPTAVVSPPAPVAEPPAEKPKPKRAPKKVGVKALAARGSAAEPTGPPIGIIEKVAPSELPVVQIKVRKITIDDRVVYLASEKDKVYDLKFNYIGRYNRREDKIESKYPDSDRE